MDLLNKLTIKNLKLNKKRTIVTIIGIILSVALITAVATMYSSGIKSLINYETYHQGYFHMAFHDVSADDVYVIENNKGIEDIYLTSNIGYAKLEDSKNELKPYAYLKAFTKPALENLSVRLIEGRLPQNENEIVIPSHLKTNGRITLNVGDDITLDIGKRVDENQEELNQYNPYIEQQNEKIINTNTKTYKIVGIIQRPAYNIENYDAPGYTFITYMSENNIKGNVDVYTKLNRYGSKNYLKISANILGINEQTFIKLNNEDFTDEEYKNLMDEVSKAKYRWDINDYLIQLENNPLGDQATGGLGIAVGIVCIIIVVTSVFCIKNSFDISISEKIKQYGMLRSVGATKKQIKRNVFYEGVILGIIGIPLGLLFGILASYILIMISNLLLKDMLSEGLFLVLDFSWIAILFACLLGIITIYLSSLRSANKAAKVNSINSIRNSADIKIKSKKIKCPLIIKKIFGIGGEIAYKNFKRNKKKYRTTIISIIVSVSVFIGLSYFINGAFRGVSNEITTYDYNVCLSIYDIKVNSGLNDKVMDTVNLENIEDYAIERQNILRVKNPKYTKEFISIQKSNDIDIEEEDDIFVLSLGEYQFKKYLKECNLNYDEYQNKAILYADNEELIKYDEKTNKTSKIYAVKYDYKKGDNINVYNEETEKTSNIEIGSVTKKKPFGGNQMKTILIVSDKMYEELFPNDTFVNIYYFSNNPDKLQDDIDKILTGEEYYVYNVNEQARLMNNLFILIAIFLYGFIIVISLIGITNIFNTITTNMNLRKQEFAMLKSIGMTSKEFARMIRLESIFIGLKSLVFGISIGLGISYLIYNFMEKESGFIFKLPILSIIISIIVVYLLIIILMRYSLSKINKENTIETIRNENI